MINLDYIFKKLDKKWLTAIINGLPEAEIRKYKIEYYKALEKNAKKTKQKNIS
tara:strand:- start:240 stop:398 length:159 start_codon:yes stop_codon:yes gene_type:complete